jgi:hypothetical protein
MKKFAFSALIALLCLAGIGKTAAQPKIVASPGTSLELGDYLKGQKAEKIMDIRNEGNDTLRIGEVHTQCGCTATYLDKKNLAPGEAGKLSITFDTHAYSGRVSKQVYIASNDTVTPKLTITFSANVAPILTSKPEFFSFDQATLDTTITRTVTITNGTPKQSIKITGMKIDNDMIKATILKNELMPGEQTQIIAVFHPTKTGSQQGDVELSTDHPMLPTLKIHIYSWVTKK